jgi:hypothetical protein
MWYLQNLKGSFLAKGVRYRECGLNILSLAFEAKALLAQF